MIVKPEYILNLVENFKLYNAAWLEFRQHREKKRFLKCQVVGIDTAAFLFFELLIDLFRGASYAVFFHGFIMWHCLWPEELNETVVLIQFSI